MNYFMKILYSIDQTINVVAAPLLNALTSENAYKFGNPDETLSSVMGKNVEKGACRGCRFICKYILHPLDRDHCKDAIEEDEHEP